MKLKLSRLSTAAAIIAGGILVLFVLSVPRTRELPLPTRQDEKASTPVVILHDVYKKGLHTLTGAVIAPDACATVLARATRTGTASTSPAIALMLTLREDAGICLSVPTRITFSTTLAAPNSLPLVVTVNGIEATTTSTPL